MKKFSIDNIIGHAWALFKKNWRTLFLVMIVTFLIGRLINIVIFGLEFPYQVWDESINKYVLGDTPMFITILTSILTILSYIFTAWFMVTEQKIYLKVVDHKEIFVKDLFTKFDKNSLWYLATAWAYGLIVMVGLVFLIVPGIYFGLKYYFAPILVLDKKLSFGDAFSESAKMTDGIKWDLFGYSITMILLAVGSFAAGLLCLVVGVIPAVMAFAATAWISQVYLYRQVLSHESSSQG